MSAHPLDIRLAHLEGAYEQISDRLNGFDLRFARLEEKVDRGFATVNERMDRSFEALNQRMDRSFEALNQRTDREAGSLRDEIADVRRTMVMGAASIVGFIIVQIVLPFFTHVR
jgi:predicted nuclease with TOPRIM domain